jgi:Arc/MetJ-type ribon-helix-helix transcriptional regulator
VNMTMRADWVQAVLGVDGDQQATAVMARLGREDLETLDTLIAAGIASSRAEAIRWTLARIRERPAYEQLRARSREIDDLKSQF